jgi:hypothetical protein
MILPSYLEDSYGVDFSDAVDYFDEIMDEINLGHRKYDIAFITSEAEFECVKDSFLDLYGDELCISIINDEYDDTKKLILEMYEMTIETTCNSIF